MHANQIGKSMSLNSFRKTFNYGAHQVTLETGEIAVRPMAQ